MTLRVVVVEDESLAREALVELLRETDDVQCVGEAADGRSAVEAIDRLRPDLVFLDVQLPEMSGLQVLEALTHDPMVVFTTAFDHYAVTAFELGAVDYLTKPFGRERLRRSLDRARQRLGRPEPSARSRAATALDPAAPLQRVFVRDKDALRPLDLAAVVRIEAQGDYVGIHAQGRCHLVRVSLSDLERRLDPRRFVRVHRSHLVNIDHVTSLVTHDERRLAVRLADGSEIVASRAGSQTLRELSL